MSKQSNTRWALVQWAVLRGHNLEDCISLVDALEYRDEAIKYSDTTAEQEEAQGEYENMVKTVKYIFEQVTESALTREGDRPQ